MDCLTALHEGLDPNLTGAATTDPSRGQRLGYTRVSSEDQNTARQLDGLSFDKVFTDKVSGGKANRPQLSALLGHAHKGDTVVVHSMDRLARNLDDLLALANGLTGKGESKASISREFGISRVTVYPYLSSDAMR